MKKTLGNNINNNNNKQQERENELRIYFDELSKRIQEEKNQSSKLAEESIYNKRKLSTVDSSENDDHIVKKQKFVPNDDEDLFESEMSTPTPVDHSSQLNYKIRELNRLIKSDSKQLDKLEKTTEEIELQKKTEFADYVLQYLSTNNVNVYYGTEKDMEENAKKYLKDLFSKGIKFRNDGFLFIIRKSSQYPNGIVIVHYSMLQDVNYQIDGEFKINSIINQDRVEIKSDSLGYYLEKKGSIDRKFHRVADFHNYLSKEFYGELRNNWRLDKLRKMGKILNGLESFELDISKDMKNLIPKPPFNGAQLSPYAKEALSFIAKCNMQHGNVFRKISQPEIMNNLMIYYNTDMLFKSIEDLVNQTHLTFQKYQEAGLFGKRIIYNDNISREDAEKQSKEKNCVIIRFTSLPTLIITQPSPKGICNRTINITHRNSSFTLNSTKNFYFELEEIYDNNKKNNDISVDTLSVDLTFKSIGHLINYIKMRATILPCNVCNEHINTNQHVPINLHCKDLHESWCIDCAKDYFAMQLTENHFEIKCHECNQIIPLEQIEKFLIDTNFQHEKKDILMSKLSMGIYKSQIKKWGYQIFPCPIPNCVGEFAMYPETLKETSYSDCTSCGKRVCLHCKEEFHTHFTCEQRQKWLKLNEEDFKRTSEWKEKNVKNCPNCKIEIEKAFGCDHMTCTACNFEFCFICGKKYFEGHLREHWVRNDPNAINGLLLQHLQLAQMGLLNPNPVTLPQNTTSTRYNIPIINTFQLSSQKPFIIHEAKDRMFVLDPVLSYMLRKHEILCKSVLDLECELNVTHVEEEIDHNTIDTTAVMIQNFS